MTFEQYYNLSSTATTVKSASEKDYQKMYSMWSGITYADNSSTEEETTEEEQESAVEERLKYEKFVEDHIVEEPEQMLVSGQDYIDAASAGTESFDSVVGELPVSDPTPKPELDAEYTKVEKEALKETKTEVKKVAVKPAKKAGRPKKRK